MNVEGFLLKLISFVETNTKSYYYISNICVNIKIRFFYICFCFYAHMCLGACVESENNLRGSVLSLYHVDFENKLTVSGLAASAHTHFSDLKLPFFIF